MFDAYATRIARPVPPATDPLAPFNFASNDYEASGGSGQPRLPEPGGQDELHERGRGTVAMRDQFVHGVITYTFDRRHI